MPGPIDSAIALDTFLQMKIARKEKAALRNKESGSVISTTSSLKTPSITTSSVTSPSIFEASTQTMRDARPNVFTTTTPAMFTSRYL
ncbi:hypothetical protein HDU99_000607 [Rhizoclosmatium hyalinum]|nr:hypothetical protein HDU99_000607 [Rhizoclosmatium hyalinum]